MLQVRYFVLLIIPFTTLYCHCHFQYTRGATSILHKSTLHSNTTCTWRHTVIILLTCICSLPCFPALPCGRLDKPAHGRIVRCSSRPVYGDTCHFQCDSGYELIGSRSRTCELADGLADGLAGRHAVVPRRHTRVYSTGNLAHAPTAVYWTGDLPVCRRKYLLLILSVKKHKKRRLLCAQAQDK